MRVNGFADPANDANKQKLRGMAKHYAVVIERILAFDKAFDATPNSNIVQPNLQELLYLERLIQHITRQAR